MTTTPRALLAVIVLCAAPCLSGQASVSTITNGIMGLRSLSAQQRPIETVKLAGEVNALPAGMDKLKLADALSNLVTEGDQGHATIQAVANTLSNALSQTPVPSKNGQPAPPYLDLARLVHYEHVTVPLHDPRLTEAIRILAGYDADAARANFTLTSLDGRKYTLSALRGKVVLVNFWATWCPPCRAEMPDLNALYTELKPQGFIVLSITDEEPQKVSKLVSQWGYHPPVLIDPGDKVHKLFHVEGIPHSFLFNRNGKLVGQSIDEYTRSQFVAMLAQAGLHP